MFIHNTPKGYVALNIMPWAELVGLNNSEGIDLKESLFQDEKIITPQRLDLLPGEYTIKLYNPDYTDTLKIPVEVRENQTTTISKKIPGFDYAQIIRNY